jgi:hypothetical protein
VPNNPTESAGTADRRPGCAAVRTLKSCADAAVTPAKIRPVVVRIAMSDVRRQDGLVRVAVFLFKTDFLL